MIYWVAMTKNTMGTKLPRKLEQEMQLVGEQIRLARLRRNPWQWGYHDESSARLEEDYDLLRDKEQKQGVI